MFGTGRRIMVRSGVRRSFSGREVLKENCEECHGAGRRLGFVELKEVML